MNSLKIKKVETSEELTDAQGVRQKVFQEEQGISFDLDVDGEDLKSDHLIAYIENKPVATLRIRYIDNKAKIERMAVLLEFRGRGIGKQIMEFAFSYLVEEKIIREIVLNAQMRAKNFYEKLGFKQKGNIFKEVGIQHIEMYKYLKDFDRWNIKKKELEKTDKTLYYYEREIWWCSLGVNIGYEEDGKNDKFERPILILKTFGNRTFWMLPLTSKIKENPYYYKCKLEDQEYISCIVLSQIKLISEKRLIRKLTMLPKEDFQKIKDEIKRFL